MLFRNDKKDPPKPGALRVPLLPLRDIIVFPHMVVPLFVGRQRSIRALEEAMGKQKFILLAAQKDAKTNMVLFLSFNKDGKIATELIYFDMMPLVEASK